jgi:hypothetical protein
VNRQRAVQEHPGDGEGRTLGEQSLFRLEDPVAEDVSVMPCGLRCGRSSAVHRIFAPLHHHEQVVGVHVAVYELPSMQLRQDRHDLLVAGL